MNEEPLEFIIDNLELSEKEKELFQLFFQKFEEKIIKLFENKKESL